MEGSSITNSHPNNAGVARVTEVDLLEGQEVTSAEGPLIIFMGAFLVEGVDPHLPTTEEEWAAETEIASMMEAPRVRVRTAALD